VGTEEELFAHSHSSPFDNELGVMFFGASKKLIANDLNKGKIE
jgi:hypothetical protein